MANKSRVAEKTRELMAALVRMPPKQHEDMKVGKRPAKKRAPKQRPKKG